MLITFHKEFDEPTLENLSEPQPIPSMDLRKLESIVEDATSDLGYHGTCLHWFSQGCSQLLPRLLWLTLQWACLASERSSGYMQYLLSVCQGWAMTRMKSREAKDFSVLSIFFAIVRMSWKLTPDKRPLLGGLNNVVVNLTLELCEL